MANYNPYSNNAGFQQPAQANLRHPQPQLPTFQQNQYNQQQANQSQQQHFQQGQFQSQAQGQSQFQGVQPVDGQQYQNFFSDPAATLASQFAKNQFESSNQYLQQNFGSFLPGSGDLKYYFRVSNSYVFRKVLLILFPYHNKNWTRSTIGEVTGSGAVDPSSSSDSQNAHFAPPIYDVNAPDLYIPLMSFITYILLWAAIQGLKGDFHPQVFGYLASQTLAFSLLDIAIFKVGLYLLNCSTQSSLWDLVSFSGYKYVSIIILLCWKHSFGNGWAIYYPLVFMLIINLAVFLMRSLKFLVLPNGVTGTANSITISQRRIRIQFLFVYSLIVQGAIILFMSR